MTLLFGSLIAGAIAAIASLATNVVQDAIAFARTGEWNKNWAFDYLGSFVGGFVGGFASTMMGGMLGSVVGGALSGGLSSLISQGGMVCRGYQDSIDVGAVFLSATISGVSAAVSEVVKTIIPLPKTPFLDNHIIANNLGNFPFLLRTPTMTLASAIKHFAYNAISPSSIVETIFEEWAPSLYDRFFGAV